MIVFEASRMSEGNKVFPTKVEISDRGITIIRPKTFGKDEKFIEYCYIGKVQVKCPLVGYSSIFLCWGIGNKIEISGFSKSDAKSIEDYIKLGMYDITSLRQKLGITDYDQLRREEEADRNQEMIERAVSAGVSKGLAQQQINIVSQSTEAPIVPQIDPMTPPPLPVFKYFAAIDGKQQGPYDEEQFAKEVKAGKINKNTMVWCSGMSGWEKAGGLDDMEDFFDL